MSFAGYFLFAGALAATAARMSCLRAASSIASLRGGACPVSVSGPASSVSGDSAWGERVFELGATRRRAVRREDELDAQFEQRTKPRGDSLVSDARPQPRGGHLEPPPEVRERIADDDRAAALDPEHEVVVLPAGKRLDPER